MPFISTKTNVTVTKEKETKLKERLGQLFNQIDMKNDRINMKYCKDRLYMLESNHQETEPRIDGRF